MAIVPSTNGELSLSNPLVYLDDKAVGQNPHNSYLNPKAIIFIIHSLKSDRDAKDY